MKKLYLLLVFLSVVAVSCNDDDGTSAQYNPSTETGFARNFGAAVQRDFIGKINDQYGDPIPNVTVKIGNSQTTTDTNGVFIINQANVHERFAYITATREGYMSGSRAMVPTDGKNIVNITMVTSGFVSETIASGETSEVTFSNTATVTFDGAFSDENGNAYSGNVTVSTYHIRPSMPNMATIMPGMLYAEDASGNETVLDSYGMLNVELRGAGGQKLQIASGHTAQIAMKIDNAQLASAPATIPLWHFDDEKGYWKEEGTATRQGDRYVGTVSHFSWWNCDANFPLSRLTFKVKDQQGNPVPNASIQLSMPGGSSGTVYTNDYGMATGMIPTNQPLTIKIYIPTLCSPVLVHTAQVGPFGSDAVLPDIVINPSVSVPLSRVTGHLLKCDNSPVTDGYVIMGSMFYPVTDGNFEFSTVICASNSNFTLFAFDHETRKASDFVTGTLATEVNVGNIACCNSTEESIIYKIDNNPEVTVVAGTMTWQDFGFEGYVSAYDDPNFGLFGFNYYESITVGTHSTEMITSIVINNIVYTPFSNSPFIVTSLDGNYLRFNFSGVFTDEQQENHTITVTANIYD